METIEQLKQDNAKLTERLNNAAKFFKEQKAQIEALTKENEELESKRNSLQVQYNTLKEHNEAVVKENEELKRKPQDDFISPDKWNALVAEKEDLNKQLNEYELKLQDAYTQRDEYIDKFETANIYISDLKKENKETEEQFNKILSQYEKEIEELNKINKDFENDKLAALADYEKEKEENTLLNVHLGELEERYGKLNEHCDNITINNQENIEEINNLKEEIKKLNEQLRYIEANNINDKEWTDHLEHFLLDMKTNIDKLFGVDDGVNNAQKKENIMKRMGDFNSSGDNIGI